MVDYTRATGSTGIMLIRDTGTNVEFWITSNNSSTFHFQLPWSYTINNVASAPQQYRYEAGMGYRRLGIWNITTSQTVVFRLGATGTSGFGGPTTFSQFINRATVVPAPTIVTLTEVTQNSMRAEFRDNGDGGSPLLEWHLGYGTDPVTPQTIITYPGPIIITGLTPGTTYYFWGRGRNAIGIGPWGPRGQATTLRVPDAPNPPTMSSTSQLSTIATFTPNGDGGTPITAYEVGYNTNPTDDPTTSLPAVSPQGILDLDAGTTYYFRVRARNAIGWSPWSSSTLLRTRAGALVKVGPIWKDAVPYVRVAGVWRVARPWIRSAGVWKESI